MEHIKMGGSSIPNFANRWDMGESTVWRYIHAGKIKTVKLGRCTRIPFEEEARIIRDGFVEPGIDAGIAKAG